MDANASGQCVEDVEVHASHSSRGVVAPFGTLRNADSCRTTFDVSDLYVDAVAFRLRGQVVRAAIVACVRIEILPGGAVRATHGSRSFFGR